VADALKKGEDLSKRFKVRKLYLDLAPQTHSAKSVKKIRTLLRVDLNVFGQLLGVPASTVRSWEEGTKMPNATACRFLDEIQRNPDYWTSRIEESILTA
jgi:DNA-binding transcriptional regulator YiaG